MISINKNHIIDVFEIESKRCCVHTGLYSKKAARLLDHLLAFAFNLYFKTNSTCPIVIGMCYQPQNFFDIVEYKNFKFFRPTLKPHFVTIRNDGEVCFYAKVGYNSFNGNEGNLSKENLIRHLTVIFCYYIIKDQHSEEDIKEMQRLIKVLTTKCKASKYEDLIGTPFDPIKNAVLTEMLQDFERIEGQKLIAWRKSTFHNDHTVKEKAQNDHIGYMLEQYRLWWKIFLLRD